jgi:hypothetical protein
VVVNIGVAVAGGVGESGIFVGATTVVAWVVGVTVFSGIELQAVLVIVSKIKQINLNDIFSSSFLC